jgi:hypothetical protein
MRKTTERMTTGKTQMSVSNPVPTEVPVIEHVHTTYNQACRLNRVLMELNDRISGFGKADSQTEMKENPITLSQTPCDTSEYLANCESLAQTIAHKLFGT